MTFLLLAVTVGWAALPLLPALRELLWPTDTEPLAVVGRDAGDVGFFATRFREYIRAQLAGAGPNADSLPDGTPVTRLAVDKPPLPPGPVDRVVVAEPWSSLPEAAVCLREVYSAGSLSAGPRTVCRAVLVEGALGFGPGSRVLRWAHAAGRLEAGRGTVFHGRASSQSLVRLEEGVEFERIGAPRLEIGRELPAAAGQPAEASTTAWPPPDGARRIGNHWRVKGDLRVPPETHFVGDLVVTGSVEIGAGARIVGSVKAHRSLLLQERVRVEGSLVTRGSLSVGEGCRIDGPVLAEGDLSVASGSIVGSLGAPTTVSAREIELQVGTVFHGAVTAQRRGRTRI